MKILVCGSRHYPAANAGFIKAVIADHITPDLLVIHGDCRTGADAFADHACLTLGIDTERHPADWKKHGRAAGPIRNRWMLDREPDLVIAFGEGRGTDDTVREANRRGIPVERHA